MTSGDSILQAYGAYREARLRLLREIECEASNRDPLAEFSERLVAAMLKGKLASNRVQPGYDLIAQTGERVQVKYLANPSVGWVNEHHVHFGHPECDSYALVFFEDLLPLAVIVFPRATISGVCSALSKRHPNQELGLQLTRRNFLQILGDEDRFTALGLRVFRLEHPVSGGEGAEGEG